MTTISKKKIVQQIVRELGRILENLAGASRAMHADASDEQNKAEDKYDTRGLETAYLASSQARQATEVEAALAAYQGLKLAKFDAKTPIALSALVEMDLHGERISYFVGPSGGGIEVKSGKTEVLVITPEAPLGQQLMGRKAGDRVKLQGRGPALEYKIVSVR